MKYFKSRSGEVFGFELDGSQDHLIADDMTAMLDVELAVFRLPSKERAFINGTWVADLQARSDAQLQELTATVQQHLDATAQSLGYDDIRSAATYADEPAVAKFQNEGKALRAWRSLVWAAAYAKMQRVKSGLEPVPTSEILFASLPAFTPS